MPRWHFAQCELVVALTPLSFNTSISSVIHSRLNVHTTGSLGLPSINWHVQLHSRWKGKGPMQQPDDDKRTWYSRSPGSPTDLECLLNMHPRL